ncbi:MAG TPA: polysaccharide biosynthesis tyrosine autokinase [Gemmatimonadaceae bacterium]|nr:polysaccharide biosynthesis tyrosine autokinase [Gemmatimonadaceae bacterium]
MSSDRFPPMRRADAELVLRRGDEMLPPYAASPSYPSPASLAPAASSPVPPTDWHRYAVAVTRHKWIVLALTLAGTLAGVVATRFLDPRYAARATLWIEVAGRERDPQAEDGLVLTPSWSTLVTSHAVLDSVVRGLRLFVRPDMPNDRAALATLELREGVVPGRYRLVVDAEGTAAELRREDGGVVQRGARGDTLGVAAGFAWAPAPAEFLPKREIPFTVVAPYDAAQGLATSLKIRPDPGGSFVTLELRGTDPDRTTATVNAIANRAVTVAAQLKKEKYQELSAILGEQYAHAQNALRQAESRLAGFQMRSAELMRSRGQPTVASLGASTNPALNASIELRVQLEQTRREKQALEELLRTPAGTGTRIAALATIPAARESPQLTVALEEVTRKQAELRALRLRYTDESAPVREALADLEQLEQRTIPALTRQLIAELSTRESLVAPRVDSAFTYLTEVPERALSEARLARDVENAATLAATVGQKYENARLELLSSQPDIRVLDSAVTPQRPISDFGPLLIVLAFATSLVLAVIAVTLKDRVDPRLRYPEQVTREMHLPILGAIPLIRTKRVADTNGEAFSETIDAFRALRVRVLHAHGVEGPVLLTITSPAAGEGKSFVSLNLALAFAYAGYRTLLVDGDVRRGVLHTALQEDQRPGLTDVLAGDQALEAALQTTEYPGLTFLSSGTRMHRAPELLMAPKLREIVGRLTQEHGVIIVDSPPLAAGIDPLVLATITGNLMLVLRSGSTDLPLATAKLEVADSLPLHTIGAVLNGVRDGGPFRYYTYDADDYRDGDVTGAGRRESWRTLLGGRT